MSIDSKYAIQNESAETTMSTVSGAPYSGNPTLKRIVIVTEHASAKFGGEAALPLHYFVRLAALGLEVRLVTHARVREEMEASFPHLQNYIHYIDDTMLHKLMWQLGSWLPARISYFTTGYISRFSTQIHQRRIVRQLVARHAIQVVHQPIPVSPKEPSLMYDLGAPVVIGPLNGGMEYPPAFRRGGQRAVGLIEAVARQLSAALNWLMPGKARAALVLVANQRTRNALPMNVRREVVCQLPENGVDLALWTPRRPESGGANDNPPLTRLVFIGRLVDWKAVDLLLRAFASTTMRHSTTLTIVGDGAERHALVQLARELQVLGDRAEQPGTVWFTGWKSQVECAQLLANQDIFILPSLWECGGAVVLEAMACGLPVIATAWGGPLDYLDDTCGILVQPDSEAALVSGLAMAIDKLTDSVEIRLLMGEAGRRKVTELYDWERKIESIVETYSRIIEAV